VQSDFQERNLRLDEIEMIVAAGRSFAADVQYKMDAIYSELQTSASTRLLVSLDIYQTQLGAITIGVVSLYESRLQTSLGWIEPFKELKSNLARLGEQGLESQVETIYLVVNALKHGTGRSHAALLAQSVPGITVRRPADSFYPEGDVCPNPDLVEVTPRFLESCCDLIETSWAKIKP
jgi:hypothetical protein